jgi:HAD superfamily hydrolase (TIGR01484 family)
VEILSTITAIKCLALDYDGTISPLKVSRSVSRVSDETFAVLERIGQHIPIIIVTTKDLRFVTVRTPFARAWSAVSGLEIQVKGLPPKAIISEHQLDRVSTALKHATSCINDPGVEIEEKLGSEDRVVAFCVDWRRAENIEEASRLVRTMEAYCKVLGLEVVRLRDQPFFDVYPISVDKGKALSSALHQLDIDGGVLYMGDSEMDNPAFDIADVSIGVIHDENRMQNLVCKYLVNFEDVHAFLSAFLESHLVFAPGFPMICINPMEVE